MFTLQKDNIIKKTDSKAKKEKLEAIGFKLIQELKEPKPEELKEPDKKPKASK